MKKNDILILAILLAMMFAWVAFYPVIERTYFPRAQPPATTTQPGTPPAEIVVPAELPTLASALSPVVAPEVSLATPEQRMTLANDDLELAVSSYGGAVISAVLKNYPAENRADSGPVLLNFETAPALRYTGLPSVAGTLEPVEGGLRYTVALGNGLSMERTLRLAGEYLLTVDDVFINRSAVSWTLPEQRLPTGPMAEATGTTAMAGIVTLGVDSFTPASGVEHWGRQLQKMFRDQGGTNQMTSTPAQIAPRRTDWVAAKNKFFVQILSPDSSADAFDLSVRMAGVGKKAVPVEVAAALQFAGQTVAAGEALTRSVQFYVGPKDYSFLKTQRASQVEVMEFRSTGFWKFMNPVMYPIKTGLLWGLKMLYKAVHNYGVAILLLTVIVRVLFWPITHKGTESMRRMQALQPQLKELQEKYKEHPQRLQQETMKFYRENKVNPMSGCLPILIQIPVFIALFVVLRSAIELRFSRFLWIRDLSEPENLFAGALPVVGSLNILPLLMAVSMVFQQKLTPSGGDPQQQKIMMVMMPLMMLFFCYTMPSGLVLYWTVSNLIVIFQMMIKKGKKA